MNHPPSLCDPIRCLSQLSQLECCDSNNSRNPASDFHVLEEFSRVPSKFRCKFELNAGALRKLLSRSVSRTSSAPIERGCACRFMRDKTTTTAEQATRRTTRQILRVLRIGGRQLRVRGQIFKCTEICRTTTVRGPATALERARSWVGDSSSLAGYKTQRCVTQTHRHAVRRSRNLSLWSRSRVETFCRHFRLMYRWFPK